MLQMQNGVILRVNIAFLKLKTCFALATLHSVFLQMLILNPELLVAFFTNAHFYNFSGVIVFLPFCF